MTSNNTESSQCDSALPVVLACAGGTPLARLSYDLAVTLEKDGLADMVCLLSFETTKDISTLQEKSIIVIDGCRRQCVKSWLAKQGITPEYYFDLSSPVFGLQPESTKECTLKDLFRVLNIIHKEIPSIPLN